MFINSMNKNLKVVITKRQLEIMKKTGGKFKFIYAFTNKIERSENECVWKFICK